ncbi:VanZ family protein [Clostridium perfringens]|uniref:VanZ family protein n=1 Tax=Clostridium perfringens TaxID=1502 RepID=UPI00016BC6FD|nr:VanZ family protein [Clostridium perfringens]EDT78063.1 vanZ family protein [Clostridium perfringens NCTC 8239]EHK2428125.1 VanZ family protein [Clostridium perfringens]ELC8384303.1 VanZ family protein [Clostridium perfringens]MDH5075797.1 VanZ like family protein [Clostridium perfringens]MDK0718957.1 VanZ family protein [Clostridium perfringens]
METAKRVLKNFFIKSILLIISVFLAMAFYKLIVKECIDVFIKIDLSGKKGFVIYNFFKLTSVMLIYQVFLTTTRMKTSKLFKLFLFGLYAGTMFILLFARPKMARGFQLDPFAVLHGLRGDRTGQLYLIGNIIFFMPIGYVLRKYNFVLAFILSASIEFNIELAQYVFKRGFFDLGDIFINLVGIFIAYFICKIAYFVKYRLYKRDHEIEEVE